MAKFSKAQFEAIADVLAGVEGIIESDNYLKDSEQVGARVALTFVVRNLANHFERYNERFNRAKFEAVSLPISSAIKAAAIAEMLQNPQEYE